MQQYATKLKNDDVKKEDVVSLISEIKEITNSIEPTTDLTMKKKQNILKWINDTVTTVDIAYGTKKGEDK